jgi:hypothetical protein
MKDLQVISGLARFGADDGLCGSYPKRTLDRSAVFGQRDVKLSIGRHGGSDPTEISEKDVYREVGFSPVIVNHS